MKSLLFCVITLLLFCANAFAGDLPDPVKTPGEINKNVTQANIHQTICVSGWTKTIRPPVFYTNKLKKQQMADMHLPGNPSQYEEDHDIPLELGGNPTQPTNLWPQLWNPADGWGAHKKDVLETRLNRLVCSGKMTLKDAQDMIRKDWIAAYKQTQGK